jgi:hypothetical protein
MAYLPGRALKYSATVTLLGHTGGEGGGAEVTVEGAGGEGLEKSEMRGAHHYRPHYLLAV